MDWIYGPRGFGIDLGLGLFAGGWAAFMAGKSELFDRGVYIGMGWLPDSVWLSVLIGLTAMHFAGLVRPRWAKLRIAASLCSSWTWISVSLSLWRVELVPGVWVYGLFGAGALCGAIYVASLTGEMRERP